MSINSYTCKICSRQFNSGMSLGGHMQIHNMRESIIPICCSIYSRKEVSVPKLDLHNKAFLKNSKDCPVCKTTHTKPKYCSKSCATKFNNGKRKHTVETKNKIANSVMMSSNRKVWPYHKVWFRNCQCCETLFVAKNHNKHNCDKCKGERKQFYRDKARFVFSKDQYPHLIDIKMLQKYGWFHNGNQQGMVFDHLYRVIDGFLNNVDPKIISHPANAELVTGPENRRRQKQSTITLDELYERISNWKY